MTQIYDWTPEILQKVRETCVWCANQNHVEGLNRNSYEIYKTREEISQ